MNKTARTMLMTAMLSTGIATGFDRIQMLNFHNAKIKKKQPDSERNDALAKAEAKRQRKAKLRAEQIQKAKQCQTSYNS